MKLRTPTVVLLTLVVAGLDAHTVRADSPGGVMTWTSKPATPFSGTQWATFAHPNGAGMLGGTPGVWGVRGLTTRENVWNDACSLELVTASLDPSRSTTAPTSTSLFAEPCSGLAKSAILPEGVFLTSLQVCTNGKEGTEGRVKGARIWGSTIDASAHLTPVATPVSFERNNCKKWENRVDCPAGTIATAITGMVTSSLQVMGLSCETVIERSKMPPPYVISAGTPTFDTAMRIPLTVEDTGRGNIEYRGVTVRVRPTPTSPPACEQTFAGEVAVLTPGNKKTINLWAKCTSLQLASSCGPMTCTPTVEWTYNLQSPIGPVGTPYPAVTGSSVVSYPKPAGAASNKAVP